MYFDNSFFTFGAKITNPIILGNTIAKIIASEKSITAPKLIDEPTTTKNKTNKPLIGYAGGPWTTLTYSMFSPTERKEPQNHIKHKEKEIEKKIKEITELTIEHGIRQADAGIDAFQLFESAAGILDDDQLNRRCIEPCKLILKENFHNVLHFIMFII